MRAERRRRPEVLQMRILVFQRQTKSSEQQSRRRPKPRRVISGRRIVERRRWSRPKSIASRGHSGRRRTTADVAGATRKAQLLRFAGVRQEEEKEKRTKGKNLKCCFLIDLLIYNLVLGSTENAVQHRILVGRQVQQAGVQGIDGRPSETTKTAQGTGRRGWRSMR